MTDVVQAVAWSIVFCLVVIVRVLTTRPAVRLLSPWVRRLGEWGSAHLNAPEDDVDPDVEVLANVRRRQQLQAHIERVRRILATDEEMSATRQVGNRLAYAWLLEELQRTPDLFPAMVSSPSVTLISHDHQRGSTVEVMEIGWRR